MQCSRSTFNSPDICVAFDDDAKPAYGIDDPEDAVLSLHADAVVVISVTKKIQRSG